MKLPISRPVIAIGTNAEPTSRRSSMLTSVLCGQTQAGCAESIERVCRAFGLNTDIKADRDAIVAAMRNDKKSSGKGLDIVLLKDIGSAFVYPASPEYFRS